MSDADTKPADLDARFQTRHLTADLGRRSVRGASVTVISQAAKFFIGFGSTMVLARLLTPADFGLVAKVYVFVGVAEIVKDLGLSMATVQREHLTHRLASTVFWINVLASALLGCALAASAPLAWIYDDPRLFDVLLVFAGVYLVGGLAGQHQALLQRQMRFTALAVIEIASRLVGVAAAVALAWAGYGYWALVAHLGAYSVAFAALVWPVTGWIPGLPSRGSGVREAVRFGSRLTAVNLLNHVVASVDKVVIGSFGSDHATGLFDRATQLLRLPLTQVNFPIGAVAIPTLSRLRGDPQRFGKAYLQSVRLITTVTAPLVVLMFLWADDLIRLMLGAQWAGAVDLFRILAAAGLVQPLLNTTGWLFIATDRSSAMLRWRLQTVWIAPLLFPVGMYLYGAEGVAITIAATSILITPLQVWVAQRDTGIGGWAVLRTAGQPILAAIVCGALLWPVVDRIPIWAAVPIMPVLHFVISCALVRSLAPVREIWTLRAAFLKRQPT